MKNNILFIILGLILALGIFWGGIYVGKESLSPTGTQSTETQANFNYYFSTTFTDGFGIIKDIDADGSSITLLSQISEDKALKLKINEDTRFYQVIKYEEGKGVTEAEPLELKELKVNDKVYFLCRPNIDGNFDLLWLNVAIKESKE